MLSHRTYSQPPYRVTLLHGGPGAPGHMAPVARELAHDCGVLEPLQTAASLEGQVSELRDVLAEHAATPVILIGSSWGAMLGFILTARHPDLVRKLVLVGSGVFEQNYAPLIEQTRASRLSDDDKRAIERAQSILQDPDATNKNEAMAEVGKIFTRIDACDPITLDTETIEVQYETFRSVWSDAVAMRSSGELLRLGEGIKCPVAAIHGVYDPHPADGVREPLSRVLKDFRFLLLGRCGHLPWIERHAMTEFYRILRRQIDCPGSSGL